MIRELETIRTSANGLPLLTSTAQICFWEGENKDERLIAPPNRLLLHIARCRFRKAFSVFLQSVSLFPVQLFPTHLQDHEASKLPVPTTF